MTAISNVIGSHCTVRGDTGSIGLSPDPSRFFRRRVWLAILSRHALQEERLVTVDCYSIFVLCVMTLCCLLTLGAHAHEGYSTHFVCVCVCVCVCSKFAALNRAYMTKWTDQHVFRQFFLIFDSSICLRCLRSRERALFTVIF